MFRFSVQRVISGSVTALIVLTATFFLLRLVPGDPASAMAAPDATPAELDVMRAYLGLDSPVREQYALYLGRLTQLDFGTSIRTGEPVLTDLLARIPASVELAVAAFILEIVIALPIGIIAAVKRESLFDHMARFGSSVGVGVPVFWLALMFLWFFAYQLDLFPLGGRLDLQYDLQRVTGFMVIDAIIAGRPDILRDALAHLVLPAVALALPSLAFWVRLMRGSLLEVLGEDHVRTARAKGLTRRKVVLKHGVRNALNPVMTALALDLVALLSAAIFVETIFAWPGIGNYIFISLQSRDYPVVQGAVILITLLYIVANAAVDVAQAKLDPRVLASVQGRYR
ncbi:ABC transporter permease subunit [soil metagenome]